ncbi:MAG: sugar ABC transporter substrate-binding protein [Gorillibacterium sp.]|nr:sugar ABC transporter substrate-binding protein [Gorillibacterium sp.]
MKSKWIGTKMIGLLIAAVMVVTTTGCGANNDNEAGSSTNTDNKVAETSAAPTETPVKEEEKQEPVTIKVFMGSKDVENLSQKKLREDFKAETGITVEPVILPQDDKFKKIDIAMTTGDDTDVIGIDNPTVQSKYEANGWLLPLDDMVKEFNYDVETIHGKYISRHDAKLYTMPVMASSWAVFYNKKVFDDAKVPYPKGAWTWDQYIETAKKLTNKDKGIYGSYMLDYDVYMYMIARQNEVSGYKADGTSNYDDPAFKASLQFFGDLGNTHKIQPSWLEFKTKKLAWDGFASGKYGMHVIGSWYFGVFTDKKNYPIDWKWGITQMPTDGKGNNNFGVSSGMAINKNAAHPKEAFKYIQFAAMNNYKYTNQLPARVDLSAAELSSVFQSISDSTGGDVTVEDSTNALVTNGLGFVQEKLVGAASEQYSKIILEESEKYLVGQQSIDQAVAAIKKRADEAIKNEANNK